jgi:sugar O-acyltransferase (sialic acid O-acetyltransferase NeuD family)
MKIAFLGYGELGRQIHAMIRSNVPCLEPVFFDDILSQTGSDSAFPFQSYSNSEFADHGAIVSLGYKHISLKRTLLDHLQTLGRTVLQFAHPSCFVDSSADLSPGSILYPMCNIDRNVRIGRGTVLNNSVTVSHDSSVGDCVYVSPGATVSGNVGIGSNVFIGSGAVISNNIKIGDGAVVGIGTVVTHDVPGGAYVLGNPMRRVKGLQLI